MTTTDTLLADLADVLDRASKLAAQMAETLDDRPSYWPERDGLFGGLAPGDRMLWEGQWREVAYTTPCPDGDGRVHVGFTDKTWVCDEATEAIRIQKRANLPDDPLRECRLPGGRIAYQEETVEHVVVGDWFQRRHGDTEWHQVERAPGSDSSICLQYRTPSGPTHEWFERGSKVRVATAPVPDPEPYR